jgi:ABC-type polysaccharide/polyol phosphate transport system ATPase subunit
VGVFRLQAAVDAPDTFSAQMPRPIVACRAVSKTFRLPHDRPSTIKQRVLHPRLSRAASELQALRDVSFEVEPGEFFGIIGRNGSGKSTMLKCLAGIYEPDGGSIDVGARVSPFIELGVGFTPELTALDNVVVNAALLGMPRSEALARFPEIIEFAELEKFVDLKLKNYSSGMQVRLGFAAAIQADAEIYLVDEVLAVGDARFQQKCFEVFRRMKRERRTVIYVTHDLGSVERFCDRALWLENGEVAALGSPSDVIGDYRRRDIELARAEAPVREQTAARWGDGAAEVVDAWLEDAGGARRDVLVKGEPVTFVALVHFKAAMEEPILGVTFKGEDGRAVFATNTSFDGVSTGSYAAGQSAAYRLRFDASFAEGAYSVSPAVAHQDAQRMADWREAFMTLNVQGGRPTAGAVDIPHETEVSRAGEGDPAHVDEEAVDLA